MDITKVAGLARMGFTDEEIARVFAVEAARSVASAPPKKDTAGARPAVAAQQRVRDHKSHAHRYVTLLAAIRADVVARGGAVESTLRELAERHPAEWKACQVTPGETPHVRGLGAVVADARMKRDGIIDGLRFRFLRVEPRSNAQSGTRGSGNTVYRVEAV